MTMRPRLRKAVLTAHVVSAVGWIGAVAAYLVLALAAETSDSVETVRAAFIAMEFLYFALVPLAAVAPLPLQWLARAGFPHWAMAAGTHHHPLKPTKQTALQLRARRPHDSCL